MAAFKTTSFTYNSQSHSLFLIMVLLTFLLYYENESKQVVDRAGLHETQIAKRNVLKNTQKIISKKFSTSQACMK